MPKYHLDKSTITGGPFRIQTNEKGYIICPKCGRRTKVKALPTTKMTDFPLYCPWCKEQTIINI